MSSHSSPPPPSSSSGSSSSGSSSSSSSGSSSSGSSSSSSGSYNSPPPPSPPTSSPPPPSSSGSSSGSNHSPPPPTPPASPPPSPPASPPPSPPQSPPPSPPQSPPQYSSPPPSKQDSPSASPPPPSPSPSPPPPSPTPPPPNTSNSPPPPNDSNPPPSPPPPEQQQTSPTTPSPPPPLVFAPPAPQGSTPNPVLSPPLAVPGTPAVPSKHPPPSKSTPNAHKSPSSSSTKDSPSESSSANVGIIGGVVVGGFFLIALIVACLVCSRRKRKQRPYYLERPPPGPDPYYNGSIGHHSPRLTDHLVKLTPPPSGANGFATPPPLSSDFSSGYSGQHNSNIPPPSPRVGGLGGLNQSQFTYEDLAAATGGFAQSNMEGQGGFGYVHKGILPDGRVIAVKSLKSGSGQGEREFQAEVEIISRVHHRHLVSLVGYCIADGQRMLVYEFLPNKTLEYHLHGAGRPPMDWPTRLRIALGSAKGLAYLHEDCHPRIIHRDIKSSNILLDSNFEAMVADFGLAKLTSDNDTHVSTRVMGTFGYLAPEYAQSGKLSEKSDVFSFGVMLLELITGRKPVDTTKMDESLVDWARPLLAKALEDGNYDPLVDPRLEGNYVAHEMAQMAGCAAASIRHSARRRPKMSQIVRSLQGDSLLEDLNDGPKGGQNSATTGNNSLNSVGYDTGAYNADMMKFRKMIMPSQEMTSSEFGATSEYGLNPSTSSDESKGNSGSQSKKL